MKVQFFRMVVLNIPELLIAFIIAATTTLLYYKWCFNYWQRRGFIIIDNPRFPFGNLNSYFTFRMKPKNLAYSMKESYDYIKSMGCKVGGFYTIIIPKLFIADLEIVKTILHKDFDYFPERDFYYNEKDDGISANLFALKEEKWKALRTRLSSAFTSGKVKMMCPNMLFCANQMKNTVIKMCEGKEVIDAEDICESYTIDVIGLCGFGLECNSFNLINTEFKMEAKKAFSMSIFRMYKIAICFLYPRIAHFLKLKLFDKESNSFFLNVVKDTIKYRREHSIDRQDYLQLLMSLQSKDEEKTNMKSLSINQIAAQVFIFFAAGFETSSRTLAFCLYEISLNQGIQNKIREEINKVLIEHDGQLTYEAIMDMNYTEQVIYETLRKYPPVSFLSRRCVNDYKFPSTNLTIEKNTEVIISIFGIHHDPEYYPEPDKFNPKRFTNEEKQKRPSFTFMPFGEGPRICIGLRVGLLQVKMGLVTLLKQFRISLNKSTEIPVKIKPHSFTFSPESKILLDVQKL